MSETLSVGKTREHNSEQIVILVHMYMGALLKYRYIVLVNATYSGVLTNVNLIILCILYYISTAQSVISYIALRNYVKINVNGCVFSL